MEAQIEIVNAEGKTVLFKKNTNCSGRIKTNNQSINTASLNAGNYFIRFVTAEGQVALKFVKE